MRTRLDAESTCLARGWRCGTRLTSSRWNNPREVRHVYARTVVLAIPGRRGPTYHYVRSLPVDVCEVRK